MFGTGKTTVVYVGLLYMELEMSFTVQSVCTVYSNVV